MVHFSNQVANLKKADFQQFFLDMGLVDNLFEPILNGEYTLVDEYSPDNFKPSYEMNF